MGSREIDSGGESINRWVDREIDNEGESTFFFSILPRVSAPAQKNKKRSFGNSIDYCSQ